MCSGGVVKQNKLTYLYEDVDSNPDRLGALAILVEHVLMCGRSEIWFPVESNELPIKSRVVPSYPGAWDY